MRPSDSWRDKATGETRSTPNGIGWSFFDRQAEVIGEYFRKGHKIYVEGRLQTDKWQDKDGNERYATNIRGLTLSPSLTAKAGATAAAPAEAEGEAAAAEEEAEGVEGVGARRVTRDLGRCRKTSHFRDSSPFPRQRGGMESLPPLPPVVPKRRLGMRPAKLCFASSLSFRNFHSARP